VEPTDIGISHWLPALIESGIHVACLPEGHGVVSWLPVDLAARAIIDSHKRMNDTIHIVHPRPTLWNTIMEPAAKSLGVPLVPYAEWLARLEHLTSHLFSSSGDNTRVLALQLLDFYRLGMKNVLRQKGTESMGLLPVVVSEKGLQTSATLKGEMVQSLGAGDVQKWLDYWRTVDFIPKGASAVNV